MSNTLDPAVVAFIQAMPKAEIHVHLEGSIQPHTLLELAHRHNQLDLLPTTDRCKLQDWFEFVDFSHFLEIYWIVSSLLRTPDDFSLITYECGADMHRQNIRYRELTFTPFTHTDLQIKGDNQRGLSIDELLSGLEAGRQQARKEFGVEMSWLFDVPRNASFSKDGTYDPYPANRTLDYALAGQSLGVVGFGLGGSEVGAPPEPFAHAFQKAKEAGFLSAPHAGETEGADSVWGAVNALQADRIGHGVRAIEDPKLLTVLQEKQIVLEVNPISNICLHLYPQAAQHPFPHLDRMGLALTVNSDDPPFFNTSLCQEYELLAREFNYSLADLVRIARNAFVYCGASVALKEQLLAEFDQWVSENLP